MSELTKGEVVERPAAEQHTQRRAPRWAERSRAGQQRPRRERSSLGKDRSRLEPRTTPMRVVTLDGTDTIVVAILAYFLGRFLTGTIALLETYRIPEAVTGGLLVALVVALVRAVGGIDSTSPQVRSRCSLSRLDRAEREHPRPGCRRAPGRSSWGSRRSRC